MKDKKKWWLSFVDGNRPKGQAFLGVAIVEAYDMVDACTVAYARGCNPGGEVKGHEIPDEVVALFDDSNMYRLLSREQANEITPVASQAEFRTKNVRD